MSQNFQEPPFDPMEDTHPTQTVPKVQFDSRGNIVRPTPLWRRLVGLVSLFGAFGLTIATVLILLSAGDDSSTTPETLPENTNTVAQEVSATPTDLPAPTATDAPVEDNTAQTQQTALQVEVQPTLDPETASILLSQPIMDNSGTGGAYTQVERDPLSPFTIIPDRPRNEIITYEVERGDNISSIAERFGLDQNTIAWSNPRRLVQALFPGDIVTIPPVDGVLVTAIGSTRTVADYAALYEVDDPFIVLDSPYNATSLAGLSIDSVPPSGAQVFIPGGQAEEISWNPTVVREEGGSGGNFISFAPEQAGSCGRVANPGGGAAWGRPMSNYQITQGYSGFHTGIDLAASVGSPVFAANSGRVIFAGWNSYGYGYTIVLAHGPFTTLYAHLDGINVGCGVDVFTGQQIGSSGNSGNSSGPHLHFEIRFNDAPQNPAATIGF